MKIFRSYDIRGLYPQELNEELVKNIGNAFAQIIKRDCIIARDMRHSSASLEKAFCSGFVDTGNCTMLIGAMPIGPARYWSTTKQLDLAYITASHLPEEWNGIKFFHWNGLGYVESELLKIKEHMGNYTKDVVKGMPICIETQDIIKSYISFIKPKIAAKRKLRIIIDCIGAPSTIAKELFEESGFESIIINNRKEPDPTTANMNELTKTIKSRKADLGIAYDGDGDRAVFFDESGRKLTSEQSAHFMLTSILNQNTTQPIVANIECSSILESVAVKFNRKLIRVRVGHTWIGAAVAAENACFSVEKSGHFIIPNIIPFDDAIAVSLYFSHILSSDTKKLSETVNEIPQYPSERISFQCQEDKKEYVMNNLKTKIKEMQELQEVPGSLKITEDGILITTEKSWALIRTSNTEPVIRLTVEGINENEFNKMKEIAENQIKFFCS